VPAVDDQKTSELVDHVGETCLGLFLDLLQKSLLVIATKL